jgi:hypothetical protein
MITSKHMTLFFILCITIASCTKDNLNPVSPIDIPKKEQVLPYGIWFNVSYSLGYQYFNYDSATSIITVGGDDGYNFRTQSIFRAKTDFQCISIDDDGSGIFMMLQKTL